MDTNNMTILTGIDDINMEILSWLDIEDIIETRLISKYFKTLYENNTLWLLKIKREFGEEHIDPKSSHKDRYFKLLKPYPYKAKHLKINIDIEMKDTNITYGTVHQYLDDYASYNDLKRGDVITATVNGVDKSFIYDCDEVIPLDYSFGTDRIPDEFECPTEFPINYWSECLPDRAVYFDTKKLGELSMDKLLTFLYDELTGKETTCNYDKSTVGECEMFAYPFRSIDKFSDIEYTYTYYIIIHSNIKNPRELLNKIRTSKHFSSSSDDDDLPKNIYQTQVLVADYDSDDALSDDDPWDFLW